MTHVRPLRIEEVDLVQPLAQRSFEDLSSRTGRPPEPRSEAGASYYRAQHHHLHRTGTALGAFSPDGTLVGSALSWVRKHTWGLALLVVEPGAQSTGAGSALLREALATAPPDSVRTFFSSGDARALRAYSRAGFHLLPTLRASGPVDPSLLEDRTGVREGDPARDSEQAGVGHLIKDLEFVLQHGGRFLVANGGCAMVSGPAPHPSVRVLTAPDEVTAQRLLRAALAAAAEPEVEVSATSLAPQEHWAVQVCVEAGLPLSVGGPVAVAGVSDPLGGVCPPAAVLI